MFGRLKIPRITEVLFICFFTFIGIKAQTAIQPSVEMEIRESYLNDQFLSHILKFTNTSDYEFNGYVQFESASEISPLSRKSRPVKIAPNDSNFVAFKLIVGKEISSGRKDVRYDLFDEDGTFVSRGDVNFEIEERVHVHLMTDDTPIMLINPEDSVRINVTVNNLGNTTEEITIVFNVPELRGMPAITELKAIIEPMSRMKFTYSFIPSSNLHNLIQFPVNITAMRGREKMLFGSRTVTVQNVLSNRNYRDTDPIRSIYTGAGINDNYITMSYRQYNSLSGVLQMQGGGLLNLPTGYIQLKGNMYKYNSMQTPVVSNSSLMYKMYENEFTVGNLSEQMELPLYGRGAKVKFSDDKKSRSITFGAIDQNYNLVSSNPWFEDYYSFYAVGEIGENNYDKGAKISYLYHKNPYERANYQLGSLQWRTAFGKNWNIEINAHTALGKYGTIKKDKFSGAAEMNYFGRVSVKISLNGSGYYSDGYFPGSRRGSINFSQSINIMLGKEVYLNGNLGYNKTEPKYISNNYEYFSENNYGNIYLSLPKISRLHTSVYYRHQGERSSVYTNHLEGEDKPDYSSMNSHRFGWQWRWQNPGMLHSLFGTIEGGFFKDPFENENILQAKATLSYSFDWLNIDLSYQKGAYYLYEYMTSKGRSSDFYRYTASASVQKNISRKIVFSAGANFSRDSYQGSIPSINVNTIWSPSDKLSLFLNSYWYRYSFVNNKNMFNTEVGLTYTFGQTKPDSGKKSKVKAQIYYDYNSNNKFDENDEPAAGYLININENVFVSDEDGEVRYTHVPYGEYKAEPLKVDSWFFSKRNFNVNGGKTKLNIPLKQSGRVSGIVEYIKSELSVDIVPRYDGFRFTITNSDNSITRIVVTDNKGNFTTFLPQDIYTITLDKKTLMEYTDCKELTRVFQVEPGKTTKLDNFEIEVKERKVNIKRFVN